MIQSPPLSGVLFAWRKLIVRSTIAAALIAVVVSLLLPPREGPGSGGIMQLVSELGSGLGGGTGKAASRIFGRSQSSELMLGVLKSRLLIGRVVDRFDLVAAYDVPTREHAIRSLGKLIEADTTPEGLIRVTVEDRDQERCAQMANTFLEFLDGFNRQMSVEAAHRTVEFIEARLSENRERQRAATEKLRRFQETQGAIQIPEQTRATVQVLADLQANRMRLEVERGVLENYASLNSPEMRRIADEIREIDQAISALRGVAPADGEDPVDVMDVGALLPLGDIPSLGIEYAELKREVMVHEKVYEFLTAQFEDARIQEARDQETIQVLDEAVPPIRKARPRRSLIVILSTLMALIASASAALAAQATLDHFNADDPHTREMRQGLRPLLTALEKLKAWGSSGAGAPESTEPQ